MKKDIYFAGGCFWGTEHFFKQIEGVTFTETGYANGNTPDPTYRQVYTDTTGHAETVHVEYDDTLVGLRFLVKMYFKAIDPTLLNRQGNDTGTRYRTGIYYTDAEDHQIISEVYRSEEKLHDKPLVVELEPLACFYPAEEHHQDYLEKNPEGYCHLPHSLFEYARKTKSDKHRD